MAVSFLRAHPTATRRSALALILLVAFILRVWNLNWDQGTHQHPDERYWSIVTSDISAAGPLEYFDSANSPLNPYNSGTVEAPRDTWVYGTFPLFTTKAAASFLADGPFPAGAAVTVADTLGIDLRTDGVDDFDAGYNANLVGRLLSALIDTATVLLVYLVGRDLLDRRAGLTAATLAAFTPLHIQYAHFYGAEPWVTFFVTGGLWLSLKLARGDLRPRVIAATGICLGLAMASKLIAAAALVMPAIAVLVATMPSIAAVTRGAMTEVANRRADMIVAGAAVAAVGLASLVLVGPLSPVGAVAVLATVGYAAIAIYVARVVLPAERAPMTNSTLYDQDSQPPTVTVEGQRPPLHIAAWGAMAGGLVLLMALATYRVFQPYTFDGLLSIDPRFTRDLDYLEGVNAGGNVPWVVQWIGRTPLLFPLGSAFWWGMGPALAIAAVVGIAVAIAATVRRNRFDLLVPLGFLAMMLGLVSQQFNPLIRYLLPAYPAAIALAGVGVVWLWDQGRRAAARPTAGAGLGGRVLRGTAVGLVALTAFWGLAFVNGVYNTEHPRIEASVWMAQNLPEGSALSFQIWDDALPLGVSGTEGFTYEHVALDPFQADVAPGKVDALIAGLDQVDYVVEASNRLYDSIPRIPAKYPSTTAYYQTLFDGRLGFERIAEFRNSPSLFGIDIPTHNAEETFTVYDHPTVTVWAKTDQWSMQRAEALLNPAQARIAADVPPSGAGTNALQFGPDANALSERGETFDEAFDTGGPIGSMPWLFWFLWLQLAALAVLPWTTRLFRALPDAGYGLAKVIGFFTVGMVTWSVVAWGVIDYSRGLALGVFGATAAVGLMAWSRDGNRLFELAAKHRRAWLATEAVFVSIFGLALLLRSANPDLWEAYLGGEKPMEMAYLTALARSSELPAVDPWFAGGFMNYYYVGWFMLTVPMRALRIVPEVGFNLGVATYAALTATVAFSVVHNLVAFSRQRWQDQSSPTTAKAPVRVGLLGVVLLMGVGNWDALRLHQQRLEAVNQWDLATDVPVLGHIVTFLGGTWAWITGAQLGRFDWWAPSRVNRGNFDITEFPYFTFLFGDLHPHMMGLAVVGLTVSVALAYLATSTRSASSPRHRLALAAALGLCTGMARVVNTWDLPSVAIVSVLAIVVGRSIAPNPPAMTVRGQRVAVLIGTLAVTAGVSNWGGPGQTALLALLAAGAAMLGAAAIAGTTGTRIAGIVGHGGVLAGVHALVFRPYIANSESIDTGLQSAVVGSPLDDFVVHWGLFLILGSAFAAALLVDYRRRNRMGDPTPGPLPDALWKRPAAKGAWLGTAAVAVVGTGGLSTGAATISIAGVIVFSAFFLTELRRADRDLGRVMATGLFALGFGIAGGVDVVGVQNDIQRMNTVFKFWLQSWQYFALAGAFAVWQVGRVLSQRAIATQTADADTDAPTLALAPARPWRTNVWGLAVVALVLAGLAYPLLGTRTRLETRFAQLPVTLDGLAYLDADPVILRVDPFDPEAEISVALGEDRPLIDWIRANVSGTPAIAEWTGNGYDWNSRIAIHTGLPSVLGWDWHQKQQRWDYQHLVDQRMRDVQAFFAQASPETTTDFLRTYGVSYVIVGTQERRFATPDSLEILASHPALAPVFTSGDNVIYRVDRAGLWPGLDPDDVDLLAFGG